MKWKTKTNDAFENIRRYILLKFWKFLLITSLDIYNFETYVNRSPWIDKIKLFSCSLSMLDHSPSGIRSHTSCLICSVVLEWQLFLNAVHININASFCQHVFRVTTEHLRRQYFDLKPNSSCVVSKTVLHYPEFFSSVRNNMYYFCHSTVLMLYFLSLTHTHWNGYYIHFKCPVP